MIPANIRTIDERHDDVTFSGGGSVADGPDPGAKAPPRPRPQSPGPRDAPAKAAPRLSDAKAPRTWPDPIGSGPFSTCARPRPVKATAPRVLRLRIPTPPAAPNRFDSSAQGRARAKRHRLWIEEAGRLVRAQRIGRISGPVTLEIAVKRTSGAPLAERTLAVTGLLVRMGVIDDAGLVEGVAARWSDTVAGAAVTVTRAP